MAEHDHISSIDEINLIEHEIERRLARRDETVASTAHMLIEASARSRAGHADDFIIDVGPSSTR